jgi:hypothetical protein
MALWSSRKSVWENRTTGHTMRAIKKTQRVYSRSSHNPTTGLQKITILTTRGKRRVPMAKARKVWSQ